MPRKVEAHACEVCGRLYVSETEAMICEGHSHKIVKSVDRQIYSLTDRSKSGAPTAIVVRLDTGELFLYKRARKVLVKEEDKHE